MTIIIRKWLPNMVKLSGPSSFAHRRKHTEILLMQIILGSDYSGYVKEIQWLLQPVLRKVILKKSLRNKKKDKMTYQPVSQGTHFSYVLGGVLLGRETLV